MNGQKIFSETENIFTCVCYYVFLTKKSLARNSWALHSCRAFLQRKSGYLHLLFLKCKSIILIFMRGVCISVQINTDMINYTFRFRCIMGMQKNGSLLCIGRKQLHNYDLTHFNRRRVAISKLFVTGHIFK